MGNSQSEATLRNLVEERAALHGQHEAKLAEIATRENKDATHEDHQMLRGLRERTADKDTEIAELTEYIEREAKAVEQSKTIRRLAAGTNNGVDVSEDGVIYRDHNSYIYDVFAASPVKEAKRITRQWGVSDEEVKHAQERLHMAELQRTPANTLSANVAGLTPPQHISQIFQVINKSRDLVQAATHADLNRGQITYPVVTTSPVVAVQGTQKTEAGNTGMVIDMVTATASTYLGGGDLSWQAINWSTPSALTLWFDLVTADYALKTETDAATVVSASAFLNNISSPIATSATFAEFMAGVGAGYAEVWANSGRTANALIIAPDRFGYLLGLTSSAFSQFAEVSQGRVGPLNVIISRGLNAGEVIVGDVSALLVAETPDAPVEMQVVEPAIGGVEVGLIGAFEAVVTDDGAFAAVSTAS